MCRRQEGEGHEGHEAPRHEEEEGRGCGGGADEGDAEEVSLFLGPHLEGHEALRRSAANRFVDDHVRGLKDAPAARSLAFGVWGVLHFRECWRRLGGGGPLWGAGVFGTLICTY